MRKIKQTVAISALLAVSCSLLAQGNIVNTAGVNYTNGAPSFLPGSKGSRIAIDTVTGRWFFYATSWQDMGDRIERRNSCTAPTAAPPKWRSNIVVNTCAAPELYRWNGVSWDCLNCATSGSANLSWTQLNDTTFRLNSSSGSDVFFRTAGTLTADTLFLQTTGGGGGGSVITDSSLDGDGTALSPLGLAQNGAATGQLLQWSGAGWSPSWGNPYVFTVATSTVSTDHNEVLVGTLSASITMGLPNCDATTDGKRFKFVRNGTDGHMVTIDPAGSQTFYDGTDMLHFYGKLAVDCTCRFSSGVGKWFYDNF